MSDKKVKVAILVGGPSPEHDVSLKSGEHVLKSLDKDRYDSFVITIGRKGEWPFAPQKLKEQSDVAFIAMHGTYGEDGHVQSILDEINLPYTGSNATTSALAMNKFLSGRLFKHHGFSIPLSFPISRKDWREKKESVSKTIFHYITPPFVVKPNNQGSSFGETLLSSKNAFEDAVNKAFAVSNEILVQEFIRGREVTCGVLDHGWGRSAYPLLPTEIVPKKSAFFDFDAKYNPEGAHEITPARFPTPLLKHIQETALRIHRLIGARGFSRTDMIITEKGRIYVLEINTIPGLTENSLIPRAAKESGIAFDELLHTVIQSALRG